MQKKRVKKHKNTTQAPAINTKKSKKRKRSKKNAKRPKTQKGKNMQKELKNK